MEREGMMRASWALWLGLGLVGCGNGDEVEAGFSRGPSPAASRPAETSAGTPEEARARASGPGGRAPEAGLVEDRPVVGTRPPPEESAPREVPIRGREAGPVGGVEPAQTSQQVASQPASAPPPGSFAYREAKAFELLEAGQSAEAARALSDLISDALIPGGEGENRRDIERWVDGLERAQERHRWRARGEWPSVDFKVEPGEGLIMLRKRVLEQHPGLLISTGLIARANQLTRPDTLQPGDTLRIPVDRANMLVDLSARWAFYRFGDEIAAAWPVGVGKPGQETPAGQYTVGIKQEHPPWHPRGREMVPYGDPENPLGSHWVGWIDENGRTTDVGFHGTSEEGGVGGAVSRGCLRMKNADVEVLHDTLPQGAAVTVQR